MREGHVFNNGDLNSYLRVVTADPEVSLRALVQSGTQRNFGKKVLAPKPSTSAAIWKPSSATTWSSASARPAPAKPIWPWPWRISALITKQVARIILTRPAVEAGERLGFLPGTLQEKVDPYLRPLYDALYDMLESERVEKLLERNVIEVAPIAFMRGRTLNDSFIILDEAQNSTSEQMKMVLTRQGFNSKMVVNGDVTQIDLPTGRRSGLIDAVEVLKGVEGISFVQFDETRRGAPHAGAAHRQGLRALQRSHRRGPPAYAETGRARSPAGSGRRGNGAAGLSAFPCPAPKAVRSHSGARRPASRPRVHRSASPAASSGKWPRARAFDCLITGDAELRRLNREFRGKDYATDVLSFPAARPVMTRQARSLWATSPSLWPAPAPRRATSDTPPKSEIRILMLHGAAAPAGHGSRNRRRPHGARRKALAGAAGPASRPDRTGAGMMLARSRPCAGHRPRCWAWSPSCSCCISKACACARATCPR